MEKSTETWSHFRSNQKEKRQLCYAFSEKHLDYVLILYFDIKMLENCIQPPDIQLIIRDVLTHVHFIIVNTVAMPLI